MLSSYRNLASAKKFFKRAIINSLVKPMVITTDKHSSYNKAITELKALKMLPKLLFHRQSKYLNNVIESDHRRIKRTINPMLGFKTFHIVRRCLFGIEAMAMMIKQQTPYLKLSVLEQVKFVKRLFYIYD